MKRSLLAAGLVTGVVAALLGPASPSHAYTDPKITVKLGQAFKVTKEPIQGNSTVFQANDRAASALPADCAGEPVGCEVVPIELDIPQEDPEAIEAQGYILTVGFDWDPGQRVDNIFQVGTVYENDLEAFLYQDPLAIDSSGSATFTARSNKTQPASLVAVSPTSKKFQLVVANYTGVNKGYTLDISLTSASMLEFDPNAFKDEKPRDFVQPTFTPPSDSTPQDNGFGGASGPAFIPPPGAPPTVTLAPGGPAPIVVPNIPGGKANPSLLAMSDVDVRSGLGLRAVNVSSTVTAAKAADSSPLAIALGLLALPLLAVLAFLFLLRRRKSGPTPTAPAAA